MKKILSIFVMATAVATFLCGCQSPRKSPTRAPAPAPAVKIYTKNPAITAPTTNTSGPTSSFKPIYSVDTTMKVAQKGGRAKGCDAALKDAISQAILANKCEDFLVIRSVYYEYSNGDVVADILGYPIVVTGVDEVSVGIYEQDKDGNIKPLDKLEHKLIFRQPFVSEEVVKGEKGAPDKVTKKLVPGEWTFYPFGGGKIDDSKPAGKAPAASPAPAPAAPGAPGAPAAPVNGNAPAPEGGMLNGLKGGFNTFINGTNN